MHYKFKVGDVVIITYSAMPRFPVGSEVTILEIDPDMILQGDHTPYCIAIEGHDRIWATETSLKRKRPPGHEEAQWHDVPWADKIRQDKLTCVAQLDTKGFFHLTDRSVL